MDGSAAKLSASVAREALLAIPRCPPKYRNVDVTGTNLLARSLVPIDSPYAAGIRSEEASNGIYTNSSAGWIWVGNTSHDQYCGVQCGPADAYDMVPDPVIRSSISDLVTRLVDFLSGH